jgi:hypothetical protein
MTTHQTETGPRIPVELQDVFLPSNRGEDVAVAPPNKMATKLFGRFGLTRRSSRLLARGRATSTRSSAVVLLGWPSSSLRAKQVLGEPTSSVPVSPEPPTDRSAGDHQHSTSNNGEKPTTANAVPAAERCPTTRSNAVAPNNLRSTSDHSMSSPTRMGPGERVSARTGRQTTTTKRDHLKLTFFVVVFLLDSRTDDSNHHCEPNQELLLQTSKWESRSQTVVSCQAPNRPNEC